MLSRVPSNRATRETKRDHTQLTAFLSSPAGLDIEQRCTLDEVRKYNVQLAHQGKPTIRIARWPDDIGAGAADYAQSVINKQTEHFDIFLGLIGARMGTPTPRANSGTEEEFDRAIELVYRGHHVEILLFFSNAPVRLGGIDPYQLLLVKAFREKVGRLGVLYHSYDSPDELRRRIHISLRKAYRNVLKSRKPAARRNKTQLTHRTDGSRVIQLGNFPFNNKLAPQGAHIYQIPIAEYRGKTMELTGTLGAASQYFRIGFKYADSREPLVSPGSVQTHGQNLMLHVGRNLRSKRWFFAYYRAGLRLDPDRPLKLFDLSKPVRFALTINPTGFVALSLNGSLTFESFFQLDGIPALAVLGWGDEHEFSCWINDLTIAVHGSEEMR